MITVEQVGIGILMVAGTAIVTAWVNSSMRNAKAPQKALESSVTELKRSIETMSKHFDMRMDRFEETLEKHAARTGAVEVDIAKVRTIQETCPTCSRRAGG